MKHSPKVIDKVFWSAYTRYAETQDMTGAEKQRVEQVLSRLFEFGASAPQSVLDAGCNSGAYTLALAMSGFKATGVDFAPGLLSSARRRAAELKVPATFEKMDLDKVFWYADNDFDHAICTSVLHAVKRPEWVLDELHRVLKPGGLLIITLWLDPVKHREAFPEEFTEPAPSSNNPGGLIARARQAAKSLSEGKRRAHYWTPAEIQQLLTRHQFEILQSQGAPLHTVVARRA
ncbi:MAG: methylase involved in ubiquinone/menaquinone biosynthesis [Chloroflexi bacterium]|jgi:ubiquinone/menaquinone biosynthesis C-methylase UbiE|nr:methylase involved in ubiquinone/menaquinone biosynthesis [Chloroflexota bacterium]